MGLGIAIKAFLKAFKSPQKAEKFIRDEQNRIEREPSHLQLLSLLQKQGRLIDFLKEDISKFNDAQIGAAVRKIHEECAKGIEEWVTVRPIFQEGEGTLVTISQGYDPTSIKVIGKVKGNPPYRGILRHKGWKAHKLSLPEGIDQKEPAILTPAEVEVRGD